MKLASKLILAIVASVSIMFSVGGALMLAINFDSTLDKTMTMNASRHALITYTLESKLLSDRLRGVDPSVDTLAQYADEFVSYAPDTSLHVVLEDGQSGFSNMMQMESEPELEPGSYIVLAQNGVHTVYYSSEASVPGMQFTVTSGYDISDIYAERSRQYGTFLIIDAAIIAVTAFTAYVIARHITKPLRTLDDVSRQISDGNYDLRTNLASTDEVGDVGRSFDRMVDTLQDEMNKRTAFVADFSHELKTPITSVIGYADILRSQRVGEEDKVEYADIIYKNSKRLESLSGKMLEMLALSEEDVTLQPVKIVQIVRRLARLYPEARDVVVDVEPQTVLAEPDLLLTLLRNLTENAIKAAEGLPVEIWGRRDGDFYTMGVSDTGPGMTEEQVLRATEPFYKTDKSRSKGGHGIGLSICQKICEVHGSTLEIDSVAGEGTTVLFALEVVQ